MKLYVKITSERASKGQGGNNCVKLDLFGEKEVVLARLMFQADAKTPDRYVLTEDASFRSHRLSIHTFKEKADAPQATTAPVACEWCGLPATHKDWREIDDMTTTTLECDQCAGLDTVFLLARQQKGKKQKGEAGHSQ